MSNDDGRHNRDGAAGIRWGRNGPVQNVFRRCHRITAYCTVFLIVLCSPPPPNPRTIPDDVVVQREAMTRVIVQHYVTAHLKPCFCDAPSSRCSQYKHISVACGTNSARQVEHKRNASSEVIRIKACVRFRAPATLHDTFDTTWWTLLTLLGGPSSRCQKCHEECRGLLHIGEDYYPSCMLTLRCAPSDRYGCAALTRQGGVSNSQCMHGSLTLRAS